MLPCLNKGIYSILLFSTFNSSPSCVLQEYLAQKRERLQKKIKEHLLSELQRAELGSKGSGDLSEIVSSFSGMLKERGGGMDRNVPLVLHYAWELAWVVPVHVLMQSVIPEWHILLYFLDRASGAGPSKGSRFTRAEKLQFAQVSWWRTHPHLVSIQEHNLQQMLENKSLKTAYKYTELHSIVLYIKFWRRKKTPLKGEWEGADSWSINWSIHERVWKHMSEFFVVRYAKMFRFETLKNTLPYF